MKKKNQANLIFSLLLGIILAFRGELQAQNCYVRLPDASGITPTQNQLDALESAACRLRDSLPVEFQNSFKVYDFGFYLHNENMVGGYPEMFQAAITQVQAQSPYYLLFGKQTDKSGIYTKFWVDLKLPNQGVFYCIDLLSPNLRDNLTIKYGIIANSVHNANENAYFLYHEAEIKTIESLCAYITTVKECCIPPGQQRRGPSCESCPFSKSEFNLFLKSENFVETRCLIQAEAGQSPSNGNAINRIVKIEGEGFNVDIEIQKYIDLFKKYNPLRNAKVYYLDYPEHCSDLSSILGIAE